MNSLIVVVLFCAALFLVSFMTKRRFGVLGLALSAGALLSLHWSDVLTPFLESQGIKLAAPPLSILVQMSLVLIPPLLLLFSGPTYTKMLPRVVGSLAFMALAVTFLEEILAATLILSGPSTLGFQFLHEHKSELIVVGVIGAIIDVLLTRKSRGHKEGKKG